MSDIIFSKIELVLFFAYFVVFSCISNKNKRFNDGDALAWFTFILFFIFEIVLHYKEISFSIFTDIEFYISVSKYMFFGIAFLCINMLVDIKRGADTCRKAWKQFLQSDISISLQSDGYLNCISDTHIVKVRKNSELLDIVTNHVTDNVTKEYAHKAIDKFVYGINRCDNVFHVKQIDTDISIKLKLDVLLESYLAVIIFWPFYATNMLAGDFLVWIFASIWNIFGNIGEYISKFFFKDIFKL